MKQAEIRTTSFGDSPLAKLISIRYQNGAQLQLTNYGAKLVALFVADKQGQPTDIVLGYPDLYGYMHGNRFFGSNPGPFANRIANASFVIDGHKTQIEPNSGKHLLHSGNKALESVFWEVEVQSESIIFTYNSPDGEFGFPGNKRFEIRYHWSEDLILTIEYHVISDKSTHINLTHHSYFNLEGEQSESILDHHIQIQASHILEVDEESIPSGKLIAVEGGPLDLRHAVKIGERIFADHPILKQTMGFDQCYVIDRNGDGLRYCAGLKAEKTGISMDVYASMPAMQFYSGNHDNGLITGKSGKIYPIHSAVCLEPQYYPNAPNIDSFPSSLIQAGQAYNETIQLQFNKNRIV